MWQSRRNPLESRIIAFKNAIGNRQVLSPSTPGVRRGGNTPRLHLLGAIICKIMRSGETIRQSSETEKSSKIKEKQCFWELLKMIKILFVCHGNICRSPMAEFIFKDMIEKAGAAERYEVASAATSAEEIGNGVYPKACRELRAHGIGKTALTDFTKKRARRMNRTDYAYYDYILCAEQWNIDNARRLLGGDPDKKIGRILDAAGGGDIDDPWYSGDFTTAYEQIARGCRALLEKLEKNA